MADRKGFTRFELLLAFGLVATLMMAVLSWINPPKPKRAQQNSQAASAPVRMNAGETVGELEELLSSVRLILGSHQACVEAFPAGTVLLPGGVDSAIDSLKLGSAEIARVGLPETGLKVTGLYLRQAAGTRVEQIRAVIPGLGATEVNRYFAELRLRTEVPGTSLPRERVFRFVAFTDSGNRLLRCHGGGGAGVLERAIASRGGGTSVPGGIREIDVREGPRAAFLEAAEGTSPGSPRGLDCNLADGWVLSGCWLSHEDIRPAPGAPPPIVVSSAHMSLSPGANGCLSREFFRAHDQVTLTAHCVRLGD